VLLATARAVEGGEVNLTILKVSLGRTTFAVVGKLLNLTSVLEFIHFISHFFFFMSLL